MKEKRQSRNKYIGKFLRWKKQMLPQLMIILVHGSKFTVIKKRKKENKTEAQNTFTLSEKDYYRYQIQKGKAWGAWVAQSVKPPTSAQVTISRFESSNPTSGSVLTAWSPEPALDSMSPSLSAPPLLTFCLSVSLSLKNKH